MTNYKKINADIKIFVWTYSQPANGRWYDLSDSDDLDAILELESDGKEYLISSVDCEISLKYEQDFQYYIDMQEYFSSNNTDLLKVAVLLNIDSNKYDSVSELVDDVEKKSLFEDNANLFSNIETLFVIMLIENDYLTETIKELYNSEYSNYINYDAIYRDWKLNGDCEKTEYNGDTYIVY